MLPVKWTVMTNHNISDSKLNPIRPYESHIYGHELHSQTQSIFCRNWMELNANFGLQGMRSEMVKSKYLIINGFIASIDVLIDNANNYQLARMESKICQHSVKPNVMWFCGSLTTMITWINISIACSRWDCLRFSYPFKCVKKRYQGGFREASVDASLRSWRRCSHEMKM